MIFVRSLQQTLKSLTQSVTIRSHAFVSRASLRMMSLAILSLFLRTRFVQALLILRKSTRKRRLFVVRLLRSSCSLRLESSSPMRDCSPSLSATMASTSRAVWVQRLSVTFSPILTLRKRPRSSALLSPMRMLRSRSVRRLLSALRLLTPSLRVATIQPT